MTERHWRRILFDGAAIITVMPLVLFFALLSHAHAAEVKLTAGDGATDYFKPDVSGNRVVWLKGVNQSGGTALLSDVYLHTLGGSTLQLNSVKKGHAPAISGSWVVWEDRRNNGSGTNTDIYGYPLSGGPEAPVVNQVSNQLFPAVDGSRRVWQDFRNGDWDIYLKDTDGLTYRITTNTGNQTEPHIDGNLIVWTDDRNGADDIYLYDLTSDTEQRITTNSAKQAGADISGRRIVWTDFRNNRRNIYHYDLDNPVPNGKPVSPNAAIQHSPRISGNLLVWTDWRNTSYPYGTNQDIYSHNFATGMTIRITTNSGRQVTPAISGNNIVWADYRNQYWDVYYFKYFNDTVAPSATVGAPVISTQISKTTKFKVTWKGADPAPSYGLASYDVRYKDGPGGAWKSWRAKTTALSGEFAGKAGRTYYFQARAKDKSGNLGSWSPAKSTIVPHDQDSLVFKRSGFLALDKTTTLSSYQNTLRRSQTPGNLIAYKVYGNKVTLVVRKGPGRSKAKIYIDGQYRATIDTYASSTKPRQAVFSASWAKAGTHYLKVVNVGTNGRPKLEIDALGVKDAP